MSTVYNDEWIVPHIPKCGGTAIGERLPRCGLGFERVGLSKRRKSSHIRLENFNELTGIDPLSRKLLAVIRDPWQREVSRYSYLQGLYKSGTRTKQVARAGEQTFEEFVCDVWNGAPYIYWENCYPSLAGYDVIDMAAMGWDEYLFWLTVDGKRHPEMTVVLLENIDSDLSKLFDCELHIEPMNRSKHVMVDWANEAVRAVYGKYWWGLKHYEHMAVVS